MNELYFVKYSHFMGDVFVALFCYVFPDVREM